VKEELLFGKPRSDGQKRQSTRAPRPLRARESHPVPSRPTRFPVSAPSGALPAQFLRAVSFRLVPDRAQHHRPAVRDLRQRHRSRHRRGTLRPVRPTILIAPQQHVSRHRAYDARQKPPVLGQKQAPRRSPRTGPSQTGCTTPARSTRCYSAYGWAPGFGSPSPAYRSSARCSRSA
jgi:hypothetical protein